MRDSYNCAVPNGWWVYQMCTESWLVYNCYSERAIYMAQAVGWESPNCVS